MTMSVLLSQTLAHSFFSEQKTLLKQPLGTCIHMCICTNVHTFLYVHVLMKVELLCM